MMSWFLVEFLLFHLNNSCDRAKFVYVQGVHFQTESKKTVGKSQKCRYQLAISVAESQLIL